jgi:hypothetical protein
VLGLLALFTHVHAFWVAGLLLALIDVPDFGTPMRRMAGSLEKIAGLKPGTGAEVPDDMARAGGPPDGVSPVREGIVPHGEAPLDLPEPARISPRKEPAHA